MVVDCPFVICAAEADRVAVTAGQPHSTICVAIASGTPFAVQCVA
jgi:hypothetical protein